MAIVINGSGTVTGISVGGLPDGIVDADTLATGAGGVDGVSSSADATAMTITSSEHIGIGTTSPAIMESRQAGKFLTVYGTATNGGILELASNKNTDDDSVGILSFVNTENGDTDGASRKYIAQIRGKVETNDSNAQDDSGGNLVFQTKADGGTIDDRLTIKSDGRVISQANPHAWCSWKGQGTVSIYDSYNVSSVTDNGVGQFTVNYSNNMTTSSPAVVCSTQETDDNAHNSGIDRLIGPARVGRNTGYIKIFCADIAGTSGRDCLINDVVVYNP